MNRLIRAEIRKLLTTSWFKVTLAVAAILGPVSAVAIALTWKGDVPLGSSDGIHRVLGSAALTSMVMLGVGIAAMAGEYRHNTSIPTFLITPRRRDVIVAKLITITGVGAIVGGISFAIALAAAVPALGSQGVHHLAGDTGQMFVGAMLASALYGALGVAIGALTRSTVTAIIAAVVWVQLVEASLLPAILPAVAKWLPTGANMAITHTAGPNAQLLAPALAMTVLLAWTAVLSITAARFTIRRDP